MKLLPVKKRKVAVLFTSGLGDALLFTPLLKELKRKNFHITCIFYSRFNNDCFFDQSFIDSKVVIRSKPGLLLYSLLRFRYFVNFYINHFGNGRMINLSATLCSKKTTKTCTTGIPGTSAKRMRPVHKELTDAEQNMHLLYSRSNSAIKKIESFYLLPTLPRKLPIKANPYFIVQVSAGNNSTPFKNWPLQNWAGLIERLCRSYPDHEFVIVGDDTEREYIQSMEKIGYINCRILIGKTTVREVFELTWNSCGYIGLDSGIMHMAVALQKKTVTIFGASNENLYGYRSIDPENHRVLVSGLPCRPCSSWKSANTSRVTDPMQCPDFACLRSIEPGYVFDEITAHFKL